MGLKKVLKKIDEMVVNGETPHNVRLDCIDIVQGEIAKKKAHKADSKPDLSQYEIVDGMCGDCALYNKCGELRPKWCKAIQQEIYRKKETPADWIGTEGIFYRKGCTVFKKGLLGDITIDGFYVPKYQSGQYECFLPIDQWYAKHGGVL